MAPLFYVAACKTTLDLHDGTEDQELYNVERVRGYIEKNPGCMRKQIIIDLEMSGHTVDRAMSIVRKQQGFKS